MRGLYYVKLECFQFILGVPGNAESAVSYLQNYIWYPRQQTPYFPNLTELLVEQKNPSHFL